MRCAKIFRGVLGFLAIFSLVSGVPTSFAKDKRAKVIDFEDEVVEGMNKRPLDSLSQISERDRRKHKPHLYRKRAGFRAEIQESLKELRYLQ